MDTPPQSNSRNNPEACDDLRYEFRNVKPQKMAHPNYQQQIKQNTEKDQQQRMIVELRGQLKYIEETNWMFESLNNNNDNF